MKISRLSFFPKSGQEQHTSSLNTFSEDEIEARREKRFLGLAALAAGVFTAQSVLRGEGDIAVQLFNAAVAAGGLAISREIAIGLRVPEVGPGLDTPEVIILADEPLDSGESIAA